MSFDFEQARGYFEQKYPAYRTNQKEKLKEIIDSFNKGKKVVILRAPVGFGKSILGYSLGMCSDSCFYSTPQKTLMAQLMKDFGGDMFREVKGRNNFLCNELLHANEGATEKERKEMTCDKGFCTYKKDYCKIHKCQPDCEYIIQRNYASKGHICLMPLAYFLVSKFPRYNPDKLVFPSRDLVIIDEAHGVPQGVLDYHTVNIYASFGSRIYSSIPIFNTITEYVSWTRDSYLANLNEIIKEGESVKSPTSKQEREENSFVKLKEKIEKFLKEYNKKPTEWIFEVKRNKYDSKLIFKPITPAQFVKEDVFSRGNHFLLMTATFSEKVDYDEFGLKKCDCDLIDIPSTFPIENRKIYYMPQGNMRKQDKEESLPKMAKYISQLLDKYHSKRVLIHAHTYSNANALYKLLSIKHKPRIILQKKPKVDKYARKNAQDAFQNKATNAVLISVCMHEGLDLKEDCCRCNIIVKTPYLDISDKRIKKRLSLNHWKWYSWQAVRGIEQAYGRAVRSDKDYADCYILDSGFHRLLMSHRDLFDSWFLEALDGKK